VWAACAVLVVANVVNIGADLAGMAEATELVTGVPSMVWTPLYAGVIVTLVLWSSYHWIVRIFRWLTLVLFAYVVTAFLVAPDWRTVLSATILPRIEWSAAYVTTLVGILGTTISPYLFFWNASQEVEEERAQGRRRLEERQGATDAELRATLVDVVTGMFFSNFVMYFIILTTAATLHASGQTSITTAREAAEALRPLAGDAAYWLFTLGLIGTGMLGVPVLAAACAYAVAEAAAWHGSLEDRPPLSLQFYAVLVAAMGLGLALDALGFDAVAMLFWSAVLNGLLAPPLIALVVLVTSDPGVMGERANPPLLRWLGWGTVAVMGLAAVIMIATVLP
jgi:Mn2+/Fe2+ NRAMP family transporter